MPTVRRPDTKIYQVQIPNETVRKIKHMLAEEGGTMQGFIENAVIRFVDLNGLIPRLEEAQKNGHDALKRNGHFLEQHGA